MLLLIKKQRLCRTKKGFEIGLLLNQILSFKAYKMYITAIFTHLVLKLYRNKIYDIHFRLRMTAHRDELFVERQS